jgi:hypothetical protein
LNSRRSAEDLYPDATPCIEGLVELGYRVALAGNQPISIEAMLGELALPARIRRLLRALGRHEAIAGVLRSRIVE